MNRNRCVTDASVEAEAVLLELIRGIAPSQRIDKSLRLSSELLRCAKAAIRRRYPEFTEDEIAVKFIELHYGSELATAVRARLESAAH
jgi:hypothetical protein